MAGPNRCSRVVALTPKLVHAQAVTGVFVSHAYADRAFVGEFVETIVRSGGNVPIEDIFYSSWSDTGIPYGQDLNSFVRAKVSSATIVIAVVSPMFQARPICIAELGAAWSHTNQLFPIAVPGLERADLDGVLGGMVIDHLDQAHALDALHDKVCTAVGSTTTAASWNRSKMKWLGQVGALAEELERPTTVSAEELEILLEERAAALEALSEAHDEVRALKKDIEDLALTKGRAEVAEVLRPKTEAGEFDLLRDSAADLLAEVPEIVSRAIFSEIGDKELEVPSRFADPSTADAVQEALIDGLLVTGSYEDYVRPNTDYASIKRALAAVLELQQFLDSGQRTTSFRNWFYSSFGVPSDLSHRIVWDELL